MKKLRLILIILLTSAFLKVFAQDYHVRIAFIGNSITIGAGLPDAPNQCYPSVVNRMLKEVYGDTCIVNNYAVSGRTLLRKGDYPIWNEPQFPLMWKFAPDIVYILMGTNDSKPYNWEPYGNEFYDDYIAMMDHFKQRNPRVKFIISFPPPAYKVVWDIRDSVILNNVIPIVDSISKQFDIPVVDFYHPLIDSVSLFPDFIHPGIQGSVVMGKMVFDKFIETDIVHKVETGFTFVTNVKSDKKVVAPGGEATISWTSINADSVLVNGIKYDVNGSIKVNPIESTKYAVYAYGPKSIDSMIYTQTVYIPELEKIAINPKSKTINQNDSLLITLKFYDQENQVMSSDLFNVEWNIKEGGGTLIEKKKESVIFIGSVAGKSFVTATAGNVSAEARVTVNEKVSVNEQGMLYNVKVYPNPINDKLNFEVISKENKLTARIFNLNGELCLSKEFINKGNTIQYEVNTKALKSGVYLFEVSDSKKLYSGKIIKE
ncbi:MAG: T9SS type A sorting domain-containing protein [Prolixibacteraceae bacterium]|nr:T9SS type A sorting domain-containing protein [Prolixibacteraceae bacterium]